MDNDNIYKGLMIIFILLKKNDKKNDKKTKEK